MVAWAALFWALRTQGIFFLRSRFLSSHLQQGEVMTF
jgi:hypothetical protein